MIGAKVRIVIDRPLGSAHPNYPKLRYPVNYGYVPGVMAADGEEQDAYLLGIDIPVTEFTGMVVAVIHRLDDIEDKWVVAPSGMVFTKEEIEAAVQFQEQYFEHEIEMGSSMLETKRLILKPASMELVDQCVDFYRRNAGFLAEYEPERDEAFYEQEFHQKLLEEELSGIAQRRMMPFYLFLKERPELLIGKINMSNIVWGSFLSCFLGAKMDQDHINQGYMTEALEAVVTYGFETLGLHRLEANVMPKNTRSLRVLEKCGFENEGISQKYLKIHGVWEDHVHMVKRNPAME